MIVGRADAVGWRLGGAGAMLGAATLWGTVGTASALADLPARPAVVGAARLAVGAVALLVFCLAARGWRALARTWSRPAWRWTVLAAAATAVYQAAFFSAVDRTGVALGTVVALGSAPAACGVLARLLAGESLPPGWTVATVAACAGCALLLLPGAGAPDALGLALALVAGVAYAMYTVALKRLLRTGAAPTASIAMTVGAGALLLAPVLLTGADGLASGRGVALAAWLGLAATATAYFLFVSALRRLPAATAATLSLAEPLTATVLALLVLDERPPAIAVAGAALLLLGLVLAARRPASPPAAVAPTPLGGP